MPNMYIYRGKKKGILHNAEMTMNCPTCHVVPVEDGWVECSQLPCEIFSAED
jgi:hypothetical protein